MRKIIIVPIILLLLFTVGVARYIAPYDERDVYPTATQVLTVAQDPISWFFGLDTNIFNSGVSDCAANEYVYGFNIDGTIDCRADETGATTTDVNDHFVPYIGADYDVDLGIYNITSTDANSTNLGATNAYITNLTISGDFNAEKIQITGVSFLDGGIITTGDSNIINIGMTGEFIGFNAVGDANVENLGIGGQLFAPFLQTGLNAPTGFPNKCSDVIISFTDSTNTFSIQPSGASFEVFHSGIQFTKTGEETIVLTDDEGAHYIYYDSSGSLAENVTPSDSELQVIIRDEAEVAVLYWNTTADQNIYFTGTNECHGSKMDGASHAHHHFTHGTLFESGLAVGDITADGTGDDNAHAQLSVSNGSIRDEDIIQTITDDSPQNLSVPANLPVFYRSGASNWRKIAATNFPVTTTGTGRAAWNEFTGGAWQLTEITNGDFVLSHVFATNNFYEPIVVIVGQADYANQVTAREGAATEINNLITSGIEFQEFVPIATIIFQTNNGYSNAVKSRIRTTDLGDDYIDWRFQDITPSVVPGNILNLVGVNTDFAKQYVLDAGDWMTGDLNGSYDLNFLNGLFRADLNVVGDANFTQLQADNIFANLDWPFVQNPPWATGTFLPDTTIDTNATAYASIQTDLNTFFCLFLDQNNASRLKYSVLADLNDHFYGKIDIDAGYVSRDTWTDIDSYPSACASGQYVTTVGDTLTCSLPDVNSFDVTFNAVSIDQNLSVRGITSLHDDLNISAGVNQGVSIEADVNVIWIGSMRIDMNGTAMIFGG